MWLLRAYGTNDELAVERSLGEVADGELERRLGFAPTKLGSTPLDAKDLASLADLYGLPIDATMAYFLDFDREPPQSKRGHSKLHLAA